MLQKKLSLFLPAEKRITATREDWIFSGIMLLMAFFIALIAWDGYIFYLARLEVKEEAISVNTPLTISEKDIQETVKLLDTRGQKFSDILEGIK